MKKIIIAVLLLCFALSGTAFADKAIVISQIAPILSAPGDSPYAERVDEVLCGMVVEVINSDDQDYLLVETAYGLVGFMRAADLNVNGAAAAAWESSVNYRVSFPHADIHARGSGGTSNPSHASAGRLLGWLPKGALINVPTGAAVGTNFVQMYLAPGVTFTNGPKESPGDGGATERFIRNLPNVATKPATTPADRFRASRVINPTMTDAQFRSAIVQDALSYCCYNDTINNVEDDFLNMFGTMAAPWRNGGKTHQGMDASGLVQMVYLLNDKLLPRDAAPKLYAGPLRYVLNPGKKDLGDVLYWDAADGMGIYIGNDQFVYASLADGKVRTGKIGVDLQASKITAWASVFFKEIISVSPFAEVEKLNGNKNNLNITILVEYDGGETDIITKKFSIDNNAADTYAVSQFKVYVDTKGNTQIRACYIVK